MKLADTTSAEITWVVVVGREGDVTAVTLLAAVIPFTPLAHQWPPIHLCFGALAVRSEKIIIAMSCSTHNFPKFIFKIVYLGKPKSCTITKGALT